MIYFIVLTIIYLIDIIYYILHLFVENLKILNFIEHDFYSNLILFAYLIIIYLYIKLKPNNKFILGFMQLIFIL